MDTNLRTKSLAFIFICLLSPTVNAKKSNTKTNSNGRFQLIQLSDMRRDQYLLDTQTGKLWNSTCQIYDEKQKACTFSAWTEVDVVSINTTHEGLVKKIEYLRSLNK